MSDPAHEKIHERIDENVEKISEIRVAEATCKGEVAKDIAIITGNIKQTSAHMNTLTAQVIPEMQVAFNKMMKKHDEVINGFGTLRANMHKIDTKADDGRLTAVCADERAQRATKALQPILDEREAAQEARKKARRDWKAWGRAKLMKAAEWTIMIIFALVVAAVCGIPITKFVLAMWGG